MAAVGQDLVAAQLVEQPLRVVQPTGLDQSLDEVAGTSTVGGDPPTGGLEEDLDGDVELAGGRERPDHVGDAVRRRRDAQDQHPVDGRQGQVGPLRLDRQLDQALEVLAGRDGPVGQAGGLSPRRVDVAGSDDGGEQRVVVVAGRRPTGLLDLREGGAGAFDVPGAGPPEHDLVVRVRRDGHAPLGERGQQALGTFGVPGACHHADDLLDLPPRRRVPAGQHRLEQGLAVLDRPTFEDVGEQRPVLGGLGGLARDGHAAQQRPRGGQPACGQLGREHRRHQVRGRLHALLTQLVEQRGGLGRAAGAAGGQGHLPAHPGVGGDPGGTHAVEDLAGTLEVPAVEVGAEQQPVVALADVHAPVDHGLPHLADHPQVAREAPHRVGVAIVGGFRGSGGRLGGRGVGRGRVGHRR